MLMSISRWVRRHRLLTSIGLLTAMTYLGIKVLFVYRIYQMNINQPDYFYTYPLRNDPPIKDHFLKLQRFNPREVSSNGKNIFLLEMGSNYVLRGRELCAAESAAKENPDHKVFVLTSSRVLSPIKLAVHLFENELEVRVHLRYLDLKTFFNGTILDGWFKDQAWKTGDLKYIPRHLSDAIRLLLLFLYGGTYLDNDTITLRSFKDLRNAIGVEPGIPDRLSNGVMVGFEAGNPFLKETMRLGALEYDPNSWGILGATSMTKVHKAFAFDTNTLNLRHHKDFFPIPSGPLCPYIICNPFEMWPSRWAYFDPGKRDFVARMIENSYTTQALDSDSWKAKVVRNSGQPIDILAQKHCPNAITMSNDF